MKKPLGLAPGAGGARGVAHIGFLKALEEEEIRADYVSGSSMGSVVGACYCKGMSPDKMLEVVKNLKFFDVAQIGLAPITKLGIMKWTKVRKMMSEFLENCDFSDLNIHFSCVAVDLKSGRQVTLSEGSVVDAMLASSSMPTVFRPVEKDGMLLVDGGVLCRVPVREVKNMGADVVVAVDVLGKCYPAENFSNVFSLIMRVYDIMDENKTRTLRNSTRKIVDLWLEPDMGDISQYKIRFYQEAYDAGYRAGKDSADKIRKLLES